MKYSEDGSNQTVLTDQNIRLPQVLTIDLVLKKNFWLDIDLHTFSSINFEGNNFLTLGTHNDSITRAFMDIIDYYIY
jgi:hypothetical protein